MNKIIIGKFEIHGFVQVVGFRYFAYRRAVELGINGYARNNYDGSVTVEAEGEEKKVLEFLRLLKTGPSRSNVEKITTDFTEACGKHTKFIVA